MHYAGPKSACFCSTSILIGTIQSRLACPLRKDDTLNREAFHVFSFIKKIYIYNKIKTSLHKPLLLSLAVSRTDDGSRGETDLRVLPLGVPSVMGEALQRLLPRVGVAPHSRLVLSASFLPASSDFDSEDYFAPPSEFSDTDLDFSNDYLSPACLDSEAKTFIRRYLGDLFGQEGGDNSAQDTLTQGLFSVRAHSDPSSTLPSEFSETLSSLDSAHKFSPCHVGSRNPFTFRKLDYDNYFAPKSLAPQTIAFSQALSNHSSSPLDNREFI